MVMAGFNTSNVKPLGSLYQLTDGLQQSTQILILYLHVCFPSGSLRFLTKIPFTIKEAYYIKCLFHSGIYVTCYLIQNTGCNILKRNSDL